MSGKLMKSVSGIRGIVGETLTPDLLVSIASAFAEYINYGTVVIGRDSRPTGEVVSNCVKSVLSMCGCDVIDTGIVPTPTVQIIVEEAKASGGIVISASHNPIEWNAFKLIDKTGSFLNSSQIKDFFAILDRGNFKYKPWNKIGEVTDFIAPDELHIGMIKDTVNVKKISSAKFRVALDSVNGAGSIITQKLLKDFRCSVNTVYCTIDGKFPRGAEPLAQNLKALSALVKKSKSDIGFAQDPDADRLAIVDENGKPIGEEYTIALVAEHLLSKKKGPVVVNLSTTKAVEDVAGKYGVPFFRSMVGEINVVEEMKKRKARIGGEGNGGVISPEVHLGRDSLAGIGYILEMMAERKKPLSLLVSELPQYFMIKGKVDISPSMNSSSILAGLKTQFSGENISDIDGLRIDFIRFEEFSGGWVHLRPSNTEPIFRIITEGKTKKQAENIFTYFKKLYTN